MSAGPGVVQAAGLDHAGIEQNLRLLQLHQARPNPKPMGSTSVTRAFEAGAYPKIVRQLQDEQLEVRQKALLAARELMGSGVGHVQCIAAGVSPVLITLLSDTDDLVRERAAGTLEYLVGKEVGARDVLQHGGIRALVGLLTDRQTSVRDAAYQALIEAARFDAVRRELSISEALVLLMKRVLAEDVSRALRGLVLLNAAVQVRHNDAALLQLIDSGAISSLVKLTSGKQAPDVQEQAAQLLGVLTSRFLDAKSAAVQEGAVASLLLLLVSPNLHLASAATTALMAITTLREGKYAVVEAKGGVAAIVQRLNPEQEQLSINLLEVLTNVCEAPEGRPQLAACGGVEVLSAIHSRPNNGSKYADMLRHSAAQALRQSGFSHLPFQLLPGREIQINNLTGDVSSVEVQTVVAVQ